MNITWMHVAKETWHATEIRSKRRENQKQMKNKTQMFHIITPRGLEKHVCAKDILYIYLIRMNHVDDCNYTLMFC